MNTSKLSKFQHQSYNIDVPTSIPPSNAPNRQKPQKSLTAKNPKNPQKFPTAKNFRAKKKSQQNFPPQKSNKNPHTKWNITKNSTIGSTRIILHYKSATLITITSKR
jgi:hypothetical protein